jgi:hypothetical protein
MGRSQGNKTGTKAPGHGGTKGKCPACKSNLKPHPFAELLPMMTSLEWQDPRRPQPLPRPRRETGMKPQAGRFQGQRRRRGRLRLQPRRPPQHDRQPEGGGGGELPPALREIRDFPANRRLRNKFPQAPEKGREPRPGRALFGVSGRYVSDARLIKEKDPKLFAAGPRRRADRLARQAARAARRAQRDVKRKTPPPASRTTRTTTRSSSATALKEMAKLPRASSAGLRRPAVQPRLQVRRRPHARPLPPHKYLDWCRRWISEARRAAHAGRHAVRDDLRRVGRGVRPIILNAGLTSAG